MPTICCSAAAGMRLRCAHPGLLPRQGVDVREYSIGDYVLNGGEVAVSVMLEAITA